MRLLTAVAALLPAAAFAATCGGHGNGETTFVSTQWLADHLKDKNLVILAIGAGQKEFEEAHIPGSVFFEYRDTQERSAAGLTTELPPMDVLAKNFAKYGVANDSRVVLYWLKDWWSNTARVYLTLDAMGLAPQTSVLNGGLPAWKAESRTVAAGSVPAPTPGKLTPCAQTDVIANLDFVKSNLHASGVRIVDARDPKVYSGESERSGMRAGHIEGAGNVYYNNLLDDNGKLKPVAELRKLFTDAGIKPGDRVVSYCFIGQQASALYTVARYLGYDARMYDGSMDEWTKHPELPIENPHQK
jgi:thiosulfate/3-mercaptopyruvate sulfurtransferase